MTTRTKLRPWGEEELQLVAACWARGESASDIALRLEGRSRCAIIGIITRNHYKRGAKVAKDAPVQQVRRLTSPLHRKSAIASYLADHAAPITLAGPKWSHPARCEA